MSLSRKRLAKKHSLPMSAQPAVMTIDRHVATLAAIFANRLRSTAGRHYRDAYDMGIVEWRIMICIGGYGPMTAGEISRKTDLNKAQVSRNITSLQAKGWIEIEQKTSIRRTGEIKLTAAGLDVYSRLHDEALERQNALLAPLTETEIDVFVAALKKLIAHVPEWGNAKAGTSQHD